MSKEHLAAQRVFNLTWVGLLAGAAAGVLATLGGYAHKEIRRRGYPLWEHCLCDYKTSSSIFQVWYSQHEQRGETIFTEEWGFLLSNPPRWLRHFFHSSSQVLAAFNPRGSYVQSITLSPQEARQLALLLRAGSVDDEGEPPPMHIVWRSEILYSPHNLFDKCIRRIYPAPLPQERLATAPPLPTLWDPQRNLPLPAEGKLLAIPRGTRIDCIGWSSSQITYCTVRNAEPR